ncbi:hypothetical protein GCM10010441_43460 [Kitasatospora paracochleata]|uniref:Secreted protein n=1 Tax=Kitasatospora paracochleata TaxID=58354 RepID=A0ABT1J2A9_9ACTN|nr:hypothetical protein [Kitasatospora paracochleata]
MSRTALFFARSVVAGGLALSLTGCFMSDPEGWRFGLRVSDGRYEVRIPLCPGEKTTEVRITTPVLWTAARLNS